MVLSRSNRETLHVGMMGRTHKRVLFRLTIMLAGLSIVASIVGVTRVEMYKPFLPEEMIPGAVSQDLVSIAVAVALLLCFHAINRGSARAWIMWLGFVGYLFYAYAIYSFDQIYTPLYPMYIAIMGTALYAAIVFFRSMHVAMFDCAELRNSTTLHRVVAMFLLIVAGMFAFSWIKLIIPAIRTGIAPFGNSIIVLDLSFILPLLVMTALWLFQGKEWGMFLGGFLLVKMGALGLSVFIGELLEPAYGNDLNPSMVALFALLGPVSLILAGVWFTRMESLGAKTTVR